MRRASLRLLGKVTRQRRGQSTQIEHGHDIEVYIMLQVAALVGSRCSVGSSCAFPVSFIIRMWECVTQASRLPQSVRIVEVGPRDGLQNEQKKVGSLSAAKTEASISFALACISRAEAVLDEDAVKSIGCQHAVPTRRSFSLIEHGCADRN